MASDQVPNSGEDEDEDEDEDAMFLQISSDMQKMLDLVNGERQSRGRSALCFNSKLNRAAIAHSNDMRDKVFFNHRGSDGSSASARVTRAGYRWNRVGENIATSRSIEKAHRNLMNSPGHRANILNSDYDNFGLGITKYTSGRYAGNYVITQVFGRSSSEGCSGGGGGGGGGGGRHFILINPNTGKALDVSAASCDDGANIHLWRRNDSGAQVFRYHEASKEIVNVKCNKAIDISAANCSNGANIQLWRRNGTGAQKFVFNSDGTVENEGCRGKVLDIAGGSHDRANIHSWSKHGGWNQKWRRVYI